MFMRGMVHVVLLLVLPALIVGCMSNSPPQAIVGTWQTGLGEKKRTMTFWHNGAWSMDLGRSQKTGSYKFVSEKQLEIEEHVPPDTPARHYKRTVSFAHHDLMHLSDEAGSMTTWKRVE